MCDRLRRPPAGRKWAQAPVRGNERQSGSGQLICEGSADQSGLRPLRATAVLAQSRTTDARRPRGETTSSRCRHSRGVVIVCWVPALPVNLACVRGEEIEAGVRAGGEVACEVVLALVDEGVVLPGRVDELERGVRQNSGNSDLPPCSDRPASRAERRRAAKEAYMRSMPKSGGQPGPRARPASWSRLSASISTLSSCRTVAIADMYLMTARSASGIRCAISSSSCP